MRPSTLSVITAKKTFSRTSVTVIWTQVASSSPSISTIRSWVSGRAGSWPCRRIMIEAASCEPIQIGRKRRPSTVFSNTIGCLPTMSKLTP